MVSRDPPDKSEQEDWPRGWEDDRLRKLTKGLEATPEQRLEWLEDAIEMAHACGALPRTRADGWSPPDLLPSK